MASRRNAAPSEAKINVDDHIYSGVVVTRQPTQIRDDRGMVHCNDYRRFAGEFHKPPKRRLPCQFVGDEYVTNPGLDEPFSLPEPRARDAGCAVLKLTPGERHNTVVLEMRAQGG